MLNDSNEGHLTISTLAPRLSSLVAAVFASSLRRQPNCQQLYRAPRSGRGIQRLPGAQTAAQQSVKAGDLATMTKPICPSQEPLRWHPAPAPPPDLPSISRQLTGSPRPLHGDHADQAAEESQGIARDGASRRDWGRPGLWPWEILCASLAWRRFAPSAACILARCTDRTRTTTRWCWKQSARRVSKVREDTQKRARARERESERARERESERTRERGRGTE